jgi:transcriptional regulator with XRE-family HTH domain
MGEIATSLGVSHQQVQKYETGRNRIGASRLPIIAKFLGCSVEDLMPATLISADDESASTTTGETGRGSALKLALAKPDVVQAALLFDAIQAPAQRLAALAVLQSLSSCGENVAPTANIPSAKAP